MRPIGKASVLLAGSLLVSCGKSDFSSNQGPGSPPQQNQASSGPPPGATPLPGSVTPPAGGVLVNQSQSECLLKKADKFHINLIFDASGSTNTTDPTNVRQQGALLFLKKFVEFVTLNPKAEVKVSAEKFARNTTRGAHGWVTLNKSTEQDMNSDIIQATSGSSGGTAYTPAVAESIKLMTEVGASADKRQRNYVVFLSDGRPNGSGEKKGTVHQVFDPLVNAHGVAVFSIAVGTGIDNDDEQVMRSIAKPLTGVVSPQHVGVYKRGTSSAELQAAWDQIFNQIAQCE